MKEAMDYADAMFGRPSGCADEYLYRPAPCYNRLIDKRMLAFMEHGELDYDGYLLRKAANMVKLTMKRFLGDDARGSIANDDEMIKFVLMHFIDGDTSCGVPIRYVERTPKKEDFLKDPAKVERLVALIKQVLNEGTLDIQTEDAKKWMVVDCPFGATLKREVISPEKIEQEKTRLFMPTNLVTHAIMLMVFSPFQSAVHSIWGSPEAYTRVGFSKTGGNVDRLSRLHKRRQFTGTGDLSGHDAHCFAMVMELANEIVREVSDHPDEPKVNAVRAELLEKHIRKTVISDDGDVYKLFWGICSGSLITSDLGTIIRMIFEMYSLLRTITDARPALRDADDTFLLERVNEHVTLSMYGDDDICSFDRSDELGLDPETFSIPIQVAHHAELGAILKPEVDVFTKFDERNSFLGWRPHLHDGLIVPRYTRLPKLLGNFLYATKDTEVDCLRSASEDYSFDPEVFGYLQCMLKYIRDKTKDPKIVLYDAPYYQRYYAYSGPGPAVAKAIFKIDAKAQCRSRQIMLSAALTLSFFTASCHSLTGVGVERSEDLSPSYHVLRKRIENELAEVEEERSTIVKALHVKGVDVTPGKRLLTRIEERIHELDDQLEDLHALQKHAAGTEDKPKWRKAKGRKDRARMLARAESKGGSLPLATSVDTDNIEFAERPAAGAPLKRGVATIVARPEGKKFFSASAAGAKVSWTKPEAKKGIPDMRRRASVSSRKSGASRASSYTTFRGGKKGDVRVMPKSGLSQLLRGPVAVRNEGRMKVKGKPENSVVSMSPATSDFIGPTRMNLAASDQILSSYVDMMVNPWCTSTVRLPDQLITPTAIAKLFANRTYTMSSTLTTNPNVLFGMHTRLSSFATNIPTDLMTVTAAQTGSNAYSTPAWSYTPGNILDAIAFNNVPTTVITNVNGTNINTHGPWSDDFGTDQSELTPYIAASRCLAAAMRFRIIGLPSGQFMTPGKLYCAQIRFNVDDVPVTEQDFVVLERLGRASHVSADSVRAAGSKTWFAVLDGQEKMQMWNGFLPACGNWPSAAIVPTPPAGLPFGFVRRFVAGIDVINSQAAAPIPFAACICPPNDTANPWEDGSGYTWGAASSTLDAPNANGTYMLIAAYFGCAPGVVLEVDYAQVHEYIPSKSAPAGLETSVMPPNHAAVDNIFTSAAVMTGLRPLMYQAPGDKTVIGPSSNPLKGRPEGNSSIKTGIMRTVTRAAGRPFSRIGTARARAEGFWDFDWLSKGTLGDSDNGIGWNFTGKSKPKR